MARPQIILEVPLTPDTSIRVVLSGPWTPAAHAKLLAHLELMPVDDPASLSEAPADAP